MFNRKSGFDKLELTDCLDNLKKLEFRVDKLQQIIEKLKIKTDDLVKINKELEVEKFKLQEKMKKLEELHEKKEEFFTMYIHDVKNPAGVIKNLADLLDSYDLTFEEQKEIIDTIMRASDKIIKLTSDVAKSIAYESDFFVINIVPSSFKEIIENCYIMNKIKAKAKGQDLIYSLDENLDYVEMDGDKITEAIDNLIDNAIKFSRIGAKIQLDARREKGYAIIEVTDEGQGLTIDEIKNAFGKGTTLSSKPTGDEISTGLGLWIVKKIIDEHHGKIWVDSIKGEGSTFAFKIPISSNQN